MTEAKKETTATVRAVGEPPNRWHLIEYGGWQVSVAPDGLLMLPRHVHPREINDFVGAMLAAAEVGAGVVAANNKDRKLLDLKDLPSDKLIVTQGDPPAGAVKAVITERAAPQRKAATIGRPKRDPRQPRTPQAPQPPMPGGRNGPAKR